MMKHFPGWRPLRKGERLIITDRFVWLFEGFGPASKCLTPETGDPVGKYEGCLADEWTDPAVKYWMPYRKVSSIHRLALSKVFSQPLPLP